MRREYTNDDLDWAREKLRRITNDPLFLVAVLEEQLRTYHAAKAQKQFLDQHKKDKK